MELHYLKSTVKSEPLIWQWYAWSFLIPPLPAACNVVERHLKIMQSYIQNPQIHAQAVKDPKLLGGPFIDLDGQKVDEIKELFDQTKIDCSRLIELCNSYKEFDRALQTEAQGDSLDSLYNRVPLALKGLVELVYDLNSNPSVRLIEPLIYNKYYSSQHQRMALSETASDFRKFSWGTPYLESEDQVLLDIPFADSRLDALFRMKEEPQCLNQIQEICKVPESKQGLFRTFFTTSPPLKASDRNFKDDGIRIRYFGHACVLLQTKSTSILLDPVISYPINSDSVPRYTFSDLPDHIDYVLLTHNHQDHFMFEMLLQLRHKIGHIVFPANNLGALEDPSIKLILKNTGFTSLVELKEMETISLGEIEITALPFLGEHADLNIQTKLSYCIQAQDKRFMFAADSNNLDSSLYEHIFDVLGPIEILFLGMECDGAPLTWTYGPLLSAPLKRSHDNNRAQSGSNFEKAWQIAEKSKCKKAYVYAMGQEPWLRYIMALEYSVESPQIIESDKFIQTCAERGIESERLFGRKEWILNSS